MLRSLLFIPANNPNMLINAALLGADAILFDLEDAVAPQEKDAARTLLYHALQKLHFSNCSSIIRINALDSVYWEEDLQTLLPLQPQIIMPPKVDDAQNIYLLDNTIGRIEQEQQIPAGSIQLIPLLETALGIENAFAIAKASPRIAGLFLGAEDLCADLHCKRTKEGAEILYARQRLVNAARAAGIEAFDTPFTNIEDIVGLKQDTAFAKSLGFSGKAAISPRHISSINAIFSPTEEEIDYAKTVLEAIRSAKKQGKGAISLKGKMIDAPIVTRAKQVLQTANALYGEEYDYHD